MAVKKKQKIPEAEKENSERWLLTYADMITLLMLFFIILYAMSKIEVKKYDEFSKVMSEILSGMNMGFVLAQSPGRGTSGSLHTGDFQQDPIVTIHDRRNAVKVMLQSRLSNQLPPYQYQITEQSDGMRISLFSNVFFEPGTAKLPEEARGILQKAAQALTDEGLLKYQIRVEGHSDPTPIDPASGFEDNWALASERALNVLRYLTNFGVRPERMYAQSSGSEHVTFTGTTPEARSQERRVDMVLLFSNEEK